MKSKYMLILVVIVIVVAYVYLNNNVRREGLASCPKGTVPAQQGGCGGCAKGKNTNGTCK